MTFEVEHRSRRAAVTAHMGRLVRAIRDGNESMVEESVLALSRTRRVFAPLAFVVGAFVMLFVGMKLLFSNWRLALVQVLPAMWIWFAMLDLKAHVFRGRSFHVLRGPVLIPIVLAIAAITATTFFLNAVFAFAITAPPPPKIRPAFRQARSHLLVVLGFGGFVGLLLGLSAVVVARIGLGWFALSMSVVIGVMMLCYVAVPSQLIGLKPTQSRRDKLAASAMGGLVGTLVCTPPYAISRAGILMLGSQLLFIPGLFVVTLGVTLQAGATGSVNAIKMSAGLLAKQQPSP